MSTAWKLAVMLVMATSCSATPSPMLDRSRLQQSFVEDFAQKPSFFDPVRNPGGRWKTNFFFSFQDTHHPRGWEARTLRPDSNLQYRKQPPETMSKAATCFLALLLLAVASGAEPVPYHYKILGVSATASAHQIKVSTYNVYAVSA